MPAVVQPINIHVGRGDIWIGVAAPSVPPVPLTGGMPATGRFIGATLTPASFHYRPVTFDIRTQQDTGIVGYVVTEEDIRIEFEVGEFTFENLRDFFIGALSGAGYISLGSLVFPPTLSALIIAPKREGQGAYIEAMVYQAVFSEDRTLAFARQTWTNPRVVARGQADLTRQQGDRLGFVAPSVISN